jgi:plastocyanin
MTSVIELVKPPREAEQPTPTMRYEPEPLPQASYPQRRPARLSWNQFLLGQIPFAAMVALIVGMVAFATVRALPPGANLPGRQLAGQAAATGGAINAFTPGTVAQQVQVAADPTGALKWDKASYEAQAGDVTFVVANASPVTHNFAVEGPGVLAQSQNFASKTINSFTLKGLKPGEYLIVCNFAGHREAGMVAKLTVK